MVIDGISGVALNSETLEGNYPIECIKYTKKIITTAESIKNNEYFYNKKLHIIKENNYQLNYIEVIALSVVKMI